MMKRLNRAVTCDGEKHFYTLIKERTKIGIIYTVILGRKVKDTGRQKELCGVLPSKVNMEYSGSLFRVILLRVSDKVERGKRGRKRKG